MGEKMREFSSKLALNQALLLKVNKIQSGEIIVIKKFSNCTGEHEVKYLLKECIKCDKLFPQSMKFKFEYVCCDACSKSKHNGVNLHGM
jgi:hypothetical protein